MFEFRRVATRPGRAIWLASAALHAIVIAVVAAIAWRAKPSTQFITLSPPVVRRMPSLPPTGGSARARGPSGGLGNPVPVAPPPVTQAAPAPVAVAEPNPAVTPPAARRPVGVEPRLPDSLIWAAPRPALPADVAELLYSPRDPKVPLPRDSIVKLRLRAMVDSMNRIIDAEQRAGRKPTWTTDVAGKKFGMDSQNIYIAGMKIPTPVLMAFGSLVPQGNFDEAMRGRQLAYIREDILQAAARTQNLEEFRKYVGELRKRKQGERDAAKHQRDSVVAKPDSDKMVP